MQTPLTSFLCLCSSYPGALMASAVALPLMDAGALEARAVSRSSRIAGIPGAVGLSCPSGVLPLQHAGYCASTGELHTARLCAHGCPLRSHQSGHGQLLCVTAADSHRCA
ncbi:hypothetical protein H8957_016819, partial [Semnopithecus entellus]